MNLSIIIPAYDEAMRLPATLQRILAFTPSLRGRVQVIVVDDGSTDQTADAVKRASPDIVLLRHAMNCGKGAAVRTGMLAATQEWRLLCDADLSTPIEDVLKLWAVHDGADVIIGSRRAAGAVITKRQSWWKVLLGQLGNVLIRMMLVPGIRDSQCGFKLFHQKTRPIFERLRTKRFGYDFELLWLARQSGYVIREVPVTWQNDTLSKVRPRDYLLTLGELFQLVWLRWRGANRHP